MSIGPQRMSPMHCHVCGEEYIGSDFSQCIMCGAFNSLTPPGEKHPEPVRMKAQAKERGFA